MPIFVKWLDRVVVRGTVDNYPIRHILGFAGWAEREPSEARRMELYRLAFRQGKTSQDWVVRPDLNDPYVHFRISEKFHPERFLRIGDEIEVVVDPIRRVLMPLDRVPHWLVLSNRDCQRGWAWVPTTLRPLEECVYEDHFFLGDITEVLSVNGGPPPKRLEERPEVWPLRGGRHPSRPLAMRGTLARLLRLLGAIPGEGDRVLIKGPPESGKTRFMMELLRELKPGRYQVLVLAIGEHEPDITEYQEVAAERGDTIVIGVPAQSSPLRRLWALERGLHWAMRKIESDGKSLVILLDSLTGAIVDPINILGTPEGVGIKTGGVNPLALDAIPIALGIARALPDGRSVTIIATELFRDPGDLPVVNKSRSVARCVITLDQDARAAGIYPPLHLGMESLRVSGQDVVFPRTMSRSTERLYGPEFARAALALNAQLGDPAHKLDRLARLIQLVERGVDDATIFHQFGVAFGEPAAPAPTPPSVGEEAEEVRPEPAPAPTPPLRPAISDEKIAEMAKAFFFDEAEEE